MTERAIKDAARLVQESKKLLERLVFEEIARTATARGLESVWFGPDRTECKKDGKTADARAFVRLESYFLDNCNERGFIAIWTRDNGWNS